MEIEVTSYGVDTVCPWCGRTMAQHHNLTGAAAPNPGDTTICMGCVGFGVFEQATDGSLYLRKPTSVEYLQLAADAEVQQILALAAKLKALRDRT